jgi:hypothetical protein
MKVWPVIYAVLIPFAVYSGFRGLRPEATAGTNPDWIFASITFVLLSLFPLGAAAYGFRYSKKEAMQRPSWDRHPLGWWTDTLQRLRFCLIYTSLMALGAAFALPSADEKGRMMFLFLVAMPAGLFVGERLVYAIYRKKIRA